MDTPEHGCGTTSAGCLAVRRSPWTFRATAIPAGATIAEIVSATSIRITPAPISALASVTFTFGGDSLAFVNVTGLPSNGFLTFNGGATLRFRAAAN